MSKIKDGQIRISHIVSVKTRDRIVEFAKQHGIKKLNVALEMMILKACQSGGDFEELKHGQARTEELLLKLLEALSVEG